MQHIINGGIYRVVFNGIYGSEFSGEHPALVIRTLKENQIYMLIPLTTYSKEKWSRIKRLGYGTRILSTNSIARIDKYQVIHKNNIKNRWKNGDVYLRVQPEELHKVNIKTNEYISLASMKAENEYNKYIDQFTTFSKQFNDILSGIETDGSFMHYSSNNEYNTIHCNQEHVKCLSMTDIREIAFRRLNINDTEIKLENSQLIIKVKNHLQ